MMMIASKALFRSSSVGVGLLHKPAPLGALLSRQLSSTPPSAMPSPSEEKSELRTGNRSHVHFNQSQKPHPLKPSYETDEYMQGDHTGRQQNHIWTKEELKTAMTTLYRHQPKSFSDHLMNKTMYGMYHTFNFVTGYKAENPTVSAIEWRLIVLESVAGVPGFVAAGFRHFRSLRTLERDHGWIATLLEEAENERMHLLVCLKMFDAGLATRTLVVTAQMVLTPLLMGVYIVHPKSMHRFVGYLEETACHTYVSIIEHLETPGTNLNEAWKDVKAPEIAIGYWKLERDAMFTDVLKCMCADETHHRDVNHTFADMAADDPNPFVDKHRENAMQAWRSLEENVEAEDRTKKV